MPDPIKVDFRKKRPAKPVAKPAPRGPPAQMGQKAVNWRALPRFLLFMLAMVLLFAGINWVARAIAP